MKLLVHGCKLLILLVFSYMVLFTCIQIIENITNTESDTYQVYGYKIKIEREPEKPVVAEKEQEQPVITEKEQQILRKHSESTQQVRLPDCPPFSSSGRIIPVNKTEVTDIHSLSKTLTTLPGGRWHPSNCRSKHKVAILLPYRNRGHMIGTWLQHMHPFLQNQSIEYGIYFIEQDFAEDFNRGALLNIGVQFALKKNPYNCVIFHDIDYLPEYTGNYYGCPGNPTHYATTVECKRWKKLWSHHFGGVSAMRTKDFLKVNGFSNGYFGWGSEDDDLSIRLHHEKLNTTQRSRKTGRYRCLSHQPATPGTGRYRLYTRASIRYKQEGLNSVPYELIKYMEMPLYTWIFVHLDKNKTRNEIWKIEKQICKTKECIGRNIWTKHTTPIS